MQGPFQPEVGLENHSQLGCVRAGVCGEKPGNKLMKPGRLQWDPSKPWVCSFLPSSGITSPKPNLEPSTAHPNVRISIHSQSDYYEPSAMDVQCDAVLAASHPRDFALHPELSTLPGSGCGRFSAQ